MAPNTAPATIRNANACAVNGSPWTPTWCAAEKITAEPTSAIANETRGDSAVRRSTATRPVITPRRNTSSSCTPAPSAETIEDPVDPETEQPIDDQRADRAEGQRVDRRLEDHRRGDVDGQRPPALGAADPQQEAQRDRGVDEQVERAIAKRVVERTRHDVGAVDAAREQHADLVGEQDREDQDQARAEVAVTGGGDRATLHTLPRGRRTGRLGTGVAAAGSFERFVAPGLADGGWTVAVIARSARRYVAAAAATSAGLTARIASS